MTSEHDRTFLIEEFHALRQELLGLKERVIREFTVGIIVIPVLIGAGEGFQLEFLLIMSPIIVVAGSLMLLFEQNSIMRVGSYIRSVIEPNLRDDPDIGWEQFLEEFEENRVAEKYFQFATVMTFAIYYITGTVLAFLKGRIVYGDHVAHILAVLYTGGFFFFIFYIVKNFAIHNKMKKRGRDK